jgi:hypothetical protein
MRAAANGGIASLLQSTVLVAAVAELEPLVAFWHIFFQYEYH